MTTRTAILSLFTGDDVVLRTYEIVRLARRNREAVEKQLTVLCFEGDLFRIAHGQYARVETARPRKVRDTTVAKLERRIAWLDERIAKLEAHWANRGNCT